MLYPKNSAPKLEDSLFRSPTSEYRGTPFWAWNCRLDGEELKWQIDILRDMGFGGFHMHVRTGMDTPYLTDEYMARVEDCVEHARENEMLAWLYDEDRWPSGFAGGIVTKEEKYRQRSLMFTALPYEEDCPIGAVSDTSARVGRRTNVEWCYLLGDFGVKVCGHESTVIPLPQTLGFGDIVPQDLPFYGGKLTYQLDFTSDGGALNLRVPHYKAAVLAVSLDGEKIADLAYPPYRLSLGTPAAGEHRLEISAYISRQNAFGPLHLSDRRVTWIGPNAWRSSGDSWTYEYNLYEEGITSAVELTEEE